MKYQLPNEYICWNCKNSHRPFAELNAQIVEWICEKCNNRNFILIDIIHFKVGHRLFIAAENYLMNDEPDIAAILLYSAVDVTLARGIFELENWKYISKHQKPSNEEEIENKLRKLNLGQKVKYFQNLAGITIDNLLAELLFKEKYKQIFLSTSLNILYKEFEKLAIERHKIVHYGKDVDKNVVLSSLPWIQRILLALDLLLERAFNNQKTNKN